MSDRAPRKYQIEINQSGNASPAEDVTLRFTPTGVRTQGDEFSHGRRIEPDVWTEVHGARVRVREGSAGDDRRAAETADWTRPELLISTPASGTIRRLRLALPDEDGADLLVGRSARKNDIVLEDEHVSRRHIRVVVRGGRHVLEDLGSRWGTFINGRRLEGPTPLAHGDEILAGKSVLRFIKFSDGFEALPESTRGVAASGPQRESRAWKSDQEEGVTFTATTLLRPPSSSGDSSDAPPPPEEPADNAVSQRFPGWLRKKNR